MGLCIPCLSRAAVLCNSCADLVMICWAAHSRTKQYIPASKISYSLELSHAPGHACVLTHSFLFYFVSSPAPSTVCSTCFLAVTSSFTCLLLSHIETSCLRVAALPNLHCSACCLKHLGFHLLWKVFTHHSINPLHSDLHSCNARQQWATIKREGKTHSGFCTLATKYIFRETNSNCISLFWISKYSDFI